MNQHEKNKTEKPNDFKLLHSLLTLSILLTLGPIAAAIYFQISFDSPAIANTCVIGAICFYILLGILAAKKGRNAILWVGFSIMTALAGLLISYILMMRAKPIVKDERDS